MFSIDGSSVLTACDDRTVKIFGRFIGECKQTLPGHCACVGFAVFSADGSLVLTVFEDFSVKIFYSSTGECKQILFGHDGIVMSAIFSSWKLLAGVSVAVVGVRKTLYDVKI